MPPPRARPGEQAGGFLLAGRGRTGPFSCGEVGADTLLRLLRRHRGAAFLPARPRQGHPLGGTDARLPEDKLGPRRCCCWGEQAPGHRLAGMPARARRRQTAPRRGRAPEEDGGGWPGPGEPAGPGAEERPRRQPRPWSPTPESAAAAAVVAFPGEGGCSGSAETGGQCVGVGGESDGAAPLKEAWRAAVHAGGSVAEWSKALDLGSSHFDGVGSNPTAAKLFCPRCGGSFSPPDQRGCRGCGPATGRPGRARRLGKGCQPRSSKSNYRKLWYVRRKVASLRRMSFGLKSEILILAVLCSGYCTLNPQALCLAFTACLGLRGGLSTLKSICDNRPPPTLILLPLLPHP